MSWNYSFSMNGQIAIPLPWGSGPDPKATKNNDLYLAPKGAYDYREHVS